MVQVDHVEAVIVGSGFGGTILALSFANKYDEENKESGIAGTPNEKRVCILERGQWWLSHEINFTPPEKRESSHQRNMLEFLDDGNRPYHFWPYPDNVKSLIQLASAVRQINKQGLYDYKVLGNVHVMAASGVGGGSLVYSNVTVEPHSSVYKNWPTEQDGKQLKEYFEKARKFIGVNKITTTTALGRNKLAKTKLFQDAAQELLDEQLVQGNVTIVNTKEIETDRGEKVIRGDFDLDLSITDIAANLFKREVTSEEERNGLLEEVKGILNQNSVCERQGRCNLGCIPEARHTLNMKLVDAMNTKRKPLEIRELCEVYDIEFIDGQGYMIRYYQHDRFTEQRKILQILAKTVIISAGSLGSTELLLKCNVRDHLQLSKMLGKRFFTNGDLFAYMVKSNTVDITSGPINTSHISFKTDDKEFAYTIEDTTIPKMVARIFATLLELDAHQDSKIGGRGFWKDLSQNLTLLRRFGLTGLVSETTSLRGLKLLFTKLWNNSSVRSFLLQNFNGGLPTDDLTFRFLAGLLAQATTDSNKPYASPEERLSKFFIFSCMGRGEKAGTLALVPSWENMENSSYSSEKITVDWSARENNRLFADILVGVKKLAAKIEKDGDLRVFSPLWNIENPEDSTTVVLHPLGGCNMGWDVMDGVTDSYGNVFWNDGSPDKRKTYPGLYVIDGSIIPEPIGVSPSLTIAAVSFRAAERIVGAQFLP